MAYESPVPVIVTCGALVKGVFHTPLVVLHFVANLLGFAHGVSGRCAWNNRVFVCVAAVLQVCAPPAAGTIVGRTSGRGLEEVLFTRAWEGLLSIVHEALAFVCAIVVFAFVLRINPIRFVHIVEALAPRIAVPVPAI
jgi:hypothetical protein